MIKKVQEFSSISEVQKTCQLSYRYLYVYKNVVYDLTDFLQLHPGGKIPLQQYKGKDLENILFNVSIHKHSSKVLQTMQKYKCGVIVERTTNQSTTATIQHKNQRQKQMPQISPKSPSEPQSQQTRVKPVTQTQNKTNKELNGQSEKLNQSFSKLNQSFSSNPSQQFLQLPNKEQLQKQQKLKQQKLLQEWKQLGLGQSNNQPITFPNQISSSNEADLIKEKIVEDRQVKSEINSTKQPAFNPFYKQWLEKQKKQKSDQSQEFKKNNPYYESWKKKQQQNKNEENLQDYSIIMEENESFQIQSQGSFVNNSMQRSLSQISSKSIVQEIPNLRVPNMEIKLITNLNNKLNKFN